jgi:hypothetical protein
MARLTALIAVVAFALPHFTGSSVNFHAANAVSMPDDGLVSAEGTQAVDDAIRFRTDLGLDADSAYVLHVATDPKASSSAYGIPLLPAEQADLDARGQLQRQLWPLEDYIADHPQEIAGIWLDQQHGQLVVVQQTGSVALSSPAADLVPAGATVRIQQVTFSHDLLAGVAAAISSDIKALGGQGIPVVSVGIDVPNNLVKVGLNPVSAAATEALKSKYRAALEFVSAQPLEPASAASPARPASQVPSLPSGCTSRSNCQLEGGLQITNIGAHICTSNFFWKYSGTKYMATAGHCWSDSSYHWYEGTTTTYPIGINFGKSFYSGMVADVMLFTQSATTPKNLIYQDDSDKSVAMTTWETNANMIVGSYTCSSGYSHLYRCGPILATDLTETVSGLVEYHMWEGDFRSGSGDSGGPEFWDYIEQGILDETDGDNSYFSTVSWINYAMGTSPCVTSTC